MKLLRGRARLSSALTVEGYVHRATRGLPVAQRLDAAAELRTHLLDRAAGHEAQGFSREEAEFLAVRAMGHPQPVNRRLLGHALTHRVGWLTLGTLLAGGLAWTAYREWMPPREGAQFETATQQDVAALFSVSDAPRGTYQAVTLTLPRGTQSLVYLNLSTDRQLGERLEVGTFDVAGHAAQNIQGRIPGSYRAQARLLITSQRLTCAGQPHARLYVTERSVPSPFWNTGAQGGGGVVTESLPACANPSLPLRQVDRPARVAPPHGENTVRTGHEPLRLNEWTVLARLVVDPQGAPNTFGFPAGGYSAQARGSYVAVLPLDRATTGNGGYRWGGGQLQLSGDAQPLPPLPPTVP
ncbi:permease prefix domain 1-containing protein [Deinococcus arcticus]|uniref:permease prefix domain 1-containing protein n=1 Tax=Deinococcus arcticus TaxID=2136176 RepID=UPI0018EAE653|nr:permease prefix domain 1-containing protein [Deinococcus arcticus]